MAGLGPQRCQQEELSRFRDDKRKPDQEKLASSEKDARRKKCQRERAPKADTVNGRDNQSVRLRSYRLSIFFESFPPFRNFCHSACMGSTGTRLYRVCWARFWGTLLDLGSA